jgi:PTS system nitrogen regulatory IIA component
MIKISKYLDQQHIVFLKAETRDEAIHALVDTLHFSGKIHDKQVFYNAIIGREKIVTTGIGMGVAIPHAKLPHYDDFFIAIGVLSKGVDWGALDGAPVRLIIMIGGPDDKQTEYLQILSNLTLAIKDEERRKKMLTLQDPKEIIKLFQAF